MENAQGRKRERDRMCDREARHRQQQHPRAAHDENKPEHEQEVVEAEQDVLDAMRQIGAGDRQRPLRRRDVDPRLGRPHQRGRMRAVQHLHAHQHVRDRCLKPDELNALSRPVPGCRRRRRGVRPGNRTAPAPRARDVVNLVREPQHDRQAHAGKHRRSPKQLVAAGPDLIDLQIGRPDLMSARERHWHHQRRQQTDQRDLEPPPMYRSRPHCGNTPVDAIGA